MQLTCLGREKSELQALVDVLLHADAALSASAAKAVGALQSPRRCADSQVLAALPKPPKDREVRAEVDRLRAGVAEARMKAAAGKAKEAIGLLQPLSARAAELHYRPLEAEALAALGYAQGYAGNLALSLATGQKAENAAEAAGDDELAITLASMLATRGAEMGKSEESQRWIIAARPSSSGWAGTNSRRGLAGERPGRGGQQARPPR